MSIEESGNLPAVIEPGSGGFSLTIPAQFRPKLILRAGEAAERRYLEFFAAQIRKKNTREAYLRACSRFLDWRDSVGIPHIEDIEPVHVAAHIELLADRTGLMRKIALRADGDDAKGDDVKGTYRCKRDVSVSMQRTARGCRLPWRFVPAGSRLSQH